MSTFKQLGWTLVLGVAFGASPGAAIAQSAVEGFIRFFPANASMPLTGSSLDAQFPGAAGWIPIGSLDQGFARQTSSTNTTETFTPLAIRKPIDAASPVLFKNCALGMVFSVELALRQTGISTNYSAPFYRATLSTAGLQSLQWAVNQDTADAGSEIVTLQYGKINWSFTSFDSNGVPTTTLSVNWNRVTQTGATGVESVALVPPTLQYPAAQTVVQGGSLTITPSKLTVSGALDQVAVRSMGPYVGAWAINPRTGVLTLTNAQPPGGPYQIVVAATDTNYLTTLASFDLTVSPLHPLPVANPDRLVRVFARTNDFALDLLLANDSSGAVFDSLPSNGTALGGRVTLAGAALTYTPPVPDPGTDDSFTYRIRDAYGQLATGTVTVGVGLVDGSPIGNLAIRLSSQGTDLHLTGLPGRSYQLQSAASLSGPWSNTGSPAVGAPTNGVASWSKLPNSTSIFYRAYCLP